MVNTYHKQIIALAGAACCIISTFLLAVLITYYVGYAPENKKIGNYVETKCTAIQQLDPVSDTCYQKCNCRSICTENSGCHQVCDQCSYTCYDGFVIFGYPTEEGEIFESSIKVINDKGHNQVIAELQKYPINSNHTCFYDKTDPNDATLSINLFKLHGTLAGVIIFAVCGGCFLFCIFSISAFLTYKHWNK